MPVSLSSGPRSLARSSSRNNTAAEENRTLDPRCFYLDLLALLEYKCAPSAPFLYHNRSSVTHGEREHLHLAGDWGGSARRCWSLPVWPIGVQVMAENGRRSASDTCVSVAGRKSLRGVRNFSSEDGVPPPCRCIVVGVRHSVASGKDLLDRFISLCRPCRIDRIWAQGSWVSAWPTLLGPPPGWCGVGDGSLAMDRSGNGYDQNSRTASLRTLWAIQFRSWAGESIAMF